MAQPDAKPDRTMEALLNRPLVKPPEGEDGLGPTVGEDVSAAEEEKEDRRHGAHSEDQGPGV